MQRMALLSPEGSVIAFFAMTRGVVPQTIVLRMHSLRMQLWNHPSHDLDCCLDRTGLLTLEARTANLDASSVLKCFRLDLAKANLNRVFREFALFA